MLMPLPYCVRAGDVCALPLMLMRLPCCVRAACTVLPLMLMHLLCAQSACAIRPLTDGDDDNINRLSEFHAKVPFNPFNTQLLCRILPLSVSLLCSGTKPFQPSALLYMLPLSVHLLCSGTTPFQPSALLHMLPLSVHLLCSGTTPCHTVDVVTRCPLLVSMPPFPSCLVQEFGARDASVRAAEMHQHKVGVSLHVHPRTQCQPVCIRRVTCCYTIGTM